MSDESRRILDLLAQGKITVEEAEALLKAARARDGSAGPSADGAVNGGEPKYLRIKVSRAANQWRPEKQVNVRVPLSMVQGGMRLGALVPGAGERITQVLRERGIDLDVMKLSPAELGAMLRDVGELSIDVDQGRAQVRITCE
jgi:hypothetical protein